MRGRKPTPTKLKLIRGNPGRRPINQHEPKVREALMHAPEWLDEEHLEQWRYAINHAPAGVLGTIDRDLLVGWVCACVTMRRAHEQQRRLDAAGTLPMLTRTPGGMAVQSPYIGIANRALDNMRKCAAELGFTPASRSRLVAGGDDADKQGLDEYDGLL